MVSIIIPSYNSEKYIAETLGSVLAQTYSDYEVLVMNDCSQDRTAEIVSVYAERDPRIHLVNLEGNRGVSSARNQGVRLAKGEWIAFLDSDDLWKADKLEKQLAFQRKLTEKDPLCLAGLLFTGSTFIDEDGNALSSVLHVPERIGFQTLLKQNVISCSSVLVRRELMLKYPMPHVENLHEDFVTWLNILKAEQLEAYGLDEPLLIYRIAHTSRSGNKLKAAIMTYHAYRYVGLGFLEAMQNWLSYSIRSIRKYSKIR